jgi:hypothetical protein
LSEGGDTVCTCLSSLYMIGNGLTVSSGNSSGLLAGGKRSSAGSAAVPLITWLGRGTVAQAVAGHLRDDNR